MNIFEYFSQIKIRIEKINTILSKRDKEIYNPFFYKTNQTYVWIDEDKMN